jgi:hypothetical protein
MRIGPDVHPDIRPVAWREGVRCSRPVELDLLGYGHDFELVDQRSHVGVLLIHAGPVLLELLHAALDMLEHAVGLAQPASLPACGELIGIIFPFGQQAIHVFHGRTLFFGQVRGRGRALGLDQGRYLEHPAVDGGDGRLRRALGFRSLDFRARMSPKTSASEDVRVRSWDSDCWRALVVSCVIFMALTSLRRFAFF